METTLRNSIESIKAYGKQIAQTGLAKCNTTAAFNAGANDAKAGKANSPTLPLSVELATPAETDDALTKYAATLWNQEQLFKQGYNELYKENYDQGYNGIPLRFSAEFCNNEVKSHRMLSYNVSPYVDDYDGYCAVSIKSEIYQDSGAGYHFKTTFSWGQYYEFGGPGSYYIAATKTIDQDTFTYDTIDQAESFYYQGRFATVTTNISRDTNTKPTKQEVIEELQKSLNNTTSETEKKNYALFIFLAEHFLYNFFTTQALSTNGTYTPVDIYLEDPLSSYEYYETATLKLSYYVNTNDSQHLPVTVINTNNCQNLGTLESNNLIYEYPVTTKMFSLSDSLLNTTIEQIGRYSSNIHLDAAKEIINSGETFTADKIFNSFKGIYKK